MFSHQPPEAEKVLVETLESKWTALFEESQDVEHSLGGIKRTFTEVPQEYHIRCPARVGVPLCLCWWLSATLLFSDHSGGDHGLPGPDR